MQKPLLNGEIKTMEIMNNGSINLMELTQSITKYKPITSKFQAFSPQPLTNIKNNKEDINVELPRIFPKKTLDDMHKKAILNNMQLKN